MGHLRGFASAAGGAVKAARSQVLRGAADASVPAGVEGQIGIALPC
jgi:hypothetical protein